MGFAVLSFLSFFFHEISRHLKGFIYIFFSLL